MKGVSSERGSWLVRVLTVRVVDGNARASEKNVRKLFLLLLLSHARRETEREREKRAYRICLLRYALIEQDNSSP